MNVDSAFRTVRSHLCNVSDAQALFFFTKAIILREFEFKNSESRSEAELQKYEKDIFVVASHAQGLLATKGKKLGETKGKKLGRDFFGYSQEVFEAADLLAMHSIRVKQLSFAAAVFAMWAYRLGHADAKGLLHDMQTFDQHNGVIFHNWDAVYFCGRILQKSELFIKEQCESIYKKVERTNCQSAQKAKLRLLQLKRPKPVAALSIYVWLRKKWHQQPAQFRAKSLRDFKALLCEAELKAPYTFCKSHHIAVSPVALNYNLFFPVHWKSPAEVLDESTFGGEALPCADGLMPDPDSNDSTG